MFSGIDYFRRSIKEIVILAFWIVFFIALALYLKFYKNIDDLATLIIKFIGPLAILIYGAASSTMKNLQIVQRLKEKGEGQEEFNVKLTYLDKLRHELVAFIVALVILVVPYFFDTPYSLAYIFAAFFTFAAIWWLKIIYFRQ